ncbi:MAG: group II intron reverse transcriptase domain-containing protein [Halobacteriovoraceae bacterium]|nr:group II intron reverse transcriptase domain-containing protein [Halobacteriovoraceae bacterium]
MKVARNLFDSMVSIENLFLCWDQFKRGKKKRKDIQHFEMYLEDFIFELHEELVSSRYQHGSYKQFHVFDPKERHISKACVRDRLVHQMVYAELSKVFDPIFIFHSLSCRMGKGTHKGVSLLEGFLRKISRNGSKKCFCLKMDIRRFFDSIDHRLLKSLIQKRIKDPRVLTLVDKIIDSFVFQTIDGRAVGLPLGNVTSQLFANIYLHELDLYVKHGLRKKAYLRFCDDFVFVSNNKDEFFSFVLNIREFLRENLFLEIHPRKIIFKSLHQGVDFLGYVLFLKYRTLRTTTKKRLKKRLKKKYSDYLDRKISKRALDQCLQSYLGILSHANQHDFSKALKNAYWIRGRTF